MAVKVVTKDSSSFIFDPIRNPVNVLFNGQLKQEHISLVLFIAKETSICLKKMDFFFLEIASKFDQSKYTVHCGSYLSKAN